MTDLTKEQLAEGKKVLEGPTIYFWVLAIAPIVYDWILSILKLVGFSLNFDNRWFSWLSFGPLAFGLIPSQNNVPWIFLALFVAALVGLYLRKSWAVPVGRAGLVVSMVIFFPVGTIFGAILWKRINDPIAKRYLGYKTDETTTAATSAGASATAEASGGKITITAEEKTEEKPEEPT